MIPWIETPEGMWAYLKTPYMAGYYQARTWNTDQPSWNTFLNDYLKCCRKHELIDSINDPDGLDQDVIARYKELLQLIHERKHNERNRNTQAQ
jgi:hypothetical protein